MPKNVKKPNPYAAKAKPAAAPARNHVARAQIPAPLRKLVQDALEGLKQPNAIPSVVIQLAVEQAYSLGVAARKK